MFSVYLLSDDLIGHCTEMKEHLCSVITMLCYNQPDWFCSPQDLFTDRAVSFPVALCLSSSLPSAEQGSTLSLGSRCKPDVSKTTHLNCPPNYKIISLTCTWTTTYHILYLILDVCKRFSHSSA